MKELIQLMNIRKDYAQKSVLNGVNLTLRKGSVYGLIGETGSGKSTIARIMAGLETPKEGEMLFRGKKIGGLRLRSFDECAAIQYIFQDPYSSLEAENTVQQVLSETVVLCRRHKRENIMDCQEAMSLVGFDDFAAWKDRKVNTLSGGQRQKLCIARAIIPKPQCIIADESTAMLDQFSSREIYGILKRLSIEIEVTLMMITHQWNVVAALCDEIYILRDGKIVESGITSDILENPDSKYAKELIGSMKWLSE